MHLCKGNDSNYNVKDNQDCWAHSTGALMLSIYTQGITTHRPSQDWCPSRTRTESKSNQAVLASVCTNS
jgi:hypothetical protein